MSIAPLQLARVSDLLRSDTTTSQIDQTQQQLQDVQQELSTGKQLNAPSDNPGDSSIVMQLQKTLDQQSAYLSNVQQGQAQLGETDSTLGDLTDLITQAQSIASQNVGSDVTSDQRAAAATIVQGLYSQAVSIGNKEFKGAYLFGGDKATSAPFISANGGVQFVGSSTILQNAADENTLLPFQVSGADVFGAPSAGVTGTANLAPSLTPTTRLIDLRGALGDGVRLGAIQLGNGTTSKLIDLSQADSVQDVVNAINSAGVGGITASISGDHLTLSAGGADNVTVTDPGGGTTAADLGIRKTTGGGGGAPVVGAGLGPNVTLLTPLAALKGGAGIDTAHGLVITNGQTTAAVSLTSAKTVEDLLNAINSSGTNVRGQIDPSGTGIDILNPVQGTRMKIGENGGTTAADLGVRSFSPSTLLNQLNDGTGVQMVNPGPDFQITRSDGTSFGISINGAQSVQDVINRINAASGGVGLTASFATTGNGIVLTDTAGGGGKLAVSSSNFSSAAANLGLTAPAVGNVIQGADVNAVEAPGLFASLAKLRDALNGNDQAGITAAASALGTDHDRVVNVRGQTGAQEQALQGRQNSLQDQNVSTQALISQLQDADMPATIAKLATLQTALQATLESAARTMSLSLMDFLA